MRKKIITWMLLAISCSNETKSEDNRQEVITNCDDLTGSSFNEETKNGKEVYEAK